MPECKVLRYVISAIDATLWAGEAVTDAVTKLATVVAMSSCNVGHIQLPVQHASTSLSATVKHTRKIQDLLLSADLDFSTNLTLTFSKDSSTTRISDRRLVTQSCALVTGGKSRSANKWVESECFQSGVIGPLPLIPVSEMQSYDVDNKPAPGQRVAESLWPV